MGTLRARIGDGRTRGRTEDRSARTATSQLRRARSEPQRAVLEQGAARMLHAGGRAIRLVAAQGGAALAATGRRAHWIRNGDRRVGVAATAGVGASSTD